MKTLYAACLLLVAVDAFGVRLEAKKDHPLKPVDSPRQEKVWREARGAFSLPDGSLWITHAAPARMEPSAMGVTRFGADGSARLFLLSDWLPKETLALGWVGQIYGVALRTDGRVAVSGGWMDRHGEVHNGLLFLRAREDGAYEVEKVIDLPGIGHIIDGPNATILAITHDALQKEPELLSIFNSDGVRIGTMFPQRQPSVVAAAQNASAARVKRVSKNRFALYDPAAQQIIVWDFVVDANNRGGVHTPLTHIFIGDDPTIDNLRVLDFEPSPDGREAVVVRSGNVRGTYGTLLTVYRAPRDVKESTFLDRPWRFTIRDRKSDVLQGVVFKKDVLIDTVHLRND
jgi:hypothetical protein